MNFSHYISNFDTNEIVLILINIFLLVISKPLLNWIYPGQSQEKKDERYFVRLGVFRGVSLLILIFVLIDGWFISLAGDPWIFRILSLSVITYVSIIVYWLIRKRIQIRFGKESTSNGAVVYRSTYASRILSLSAGMVITLLALISLVQVFGFNSWLEAGGVLGIIGVMLAITQAAWVPDLISGLIIMNSRLVDEGDVVQIDTGEKEMLGVVFRTKIFYTEILHLVNNHRIMLQNSKLRSYTVHNLSRFASAKGLREAVSINISYEISEDQVQKLFNQVFEQAIQDASIDLESQHEPEIRATRGGDFSVEWTCYYYTKEARKVLRTRQLIRSLVLRVAREQGIDLATPDLFANTASNSAFPGP